MVRANTTFVVKGIVKTLSKSRLVQKIVEHHIYNTKMSFSVLQKIWFDDLQGDNGVLRKLTDIDKKNESNYHINTPITLGDGTKIVVCNQWGQENLSNFILHAELLGFEIKSKGNQKYYSSM